jgi:protocatechuate 3,4-dioxygenase, alpha subunit
VPGRSPSQTVGPYFSIALPWKDGGVVTGCSGERIVLEGHVLDGAGAPGPDALVETWQAPDRGVAPSASGKPHGFGRASADASGLYRIETAMPAGGTPYLDVTILARGLLKALHTRVYFAEEPRVRAEAALAPLASSPRLATLVARKAADGEYRWDIRLQGEGETIFFAV